MNWVHRDFQLNNRSFSNALELVNDSHTKSISLYNFLNDWFDEKDYIIVKTSGSTGKPKDIQLKKEQMKNSAIATGEFFDVQEKTKALCCLPIDFIAGKMMVVRAMILGWHLDIIESNSNPLENIDEEYDFSAMVPLQLRNSLKKIHQIKTLIVGGGVISHQLEEAIKSIRTKIYATYGMTETITHIAVRKLNNFQTVTPSVVERSHYQLLPNVSIFTDDRNCLVINAPKVSDETIITNDVAEIISENEFEWKGRYDNVINSGGIKLHPEEIERKLSSHIQSRFFVAGIPDEKLGEKLILIIEELVTPSAVEKSLHLKIKNISSLSKFEIPKEIFFVSEFLETETGKIQRGKTLKKAFISL